MPSPCTAAPPAAAHPAFLLRTPLHHSQLKATHLGHGDAVGVERLHQDEVHALHLRSTK